MTTPIAADLNIKIADEAWITATYSLAFASTLLFAGRLADLFPPHRIYTIGFIGIAVLYLVISFLNDQYSFFVLRAISALFAVWTIPSSINMIGKFRRTNELRPMETRRGGRGGWVGEREWCNARWGKAGEEKEIEERFPPGFRNLVGQPENAVKLILFPSSNVSRTN
jgi:MFS family permease